MVTSLSTTQSTMNCLTATLFHMQEPVETAPVPLHHRLLPPPPPASPPPPPAPSPPPPAHPSHPSKCMALALTLGGPSGEQPLCWGERHPAHHGCHTPASARVGCAVPCSGSLAHPWRSMLSPGYSALTWRGAWLLRGHPGEPRAPH